MITTDNGCYTSKGFGLTYIHGGSALIPAGDPSRGLLD